MSLLWRGKELTGRRIKGGAAAGLMAETDMQKGDDDDFAAVAPHKSLTKMGFLYLN